MANNISNHSYLDITANIAIGNNEATAIDYLHPAKIKLALASKKLTPIRLESQVTASTIMRNQQINELMEKYYHSLKQLDNLILALNELKNAPTKTLTEEQYQQRLTLVQQLTKDFEAIKRNLLDLGSKIAYLHDVNQDLHEKAKRKMDTVLQEIDQINQHKVKTILEHLRTLNIDVNKPDLAEKLLYAISHPDIQAAFMSECGMQPNKGFTQKLKEWFK